MTAMTSMFPRVFAEEAQLMIVRLFMGSGFEITMFGKYEIPSTAISKTIVSDDIRKEVNSYPERVSKPMESAAMISRKRMANP